MEIPARFRRAMLGNKRESAGKDGPLSIGRGFQKSLQHAVNCGIVADVVYDVGARVGTPWLYEAFPKAQHLLFEPLTIQVETLKANYLSPDFEIHQTAIGAQRGIVKLHVPSGPNARLTWSSLAKTTEEFAKFVKARGVIFETDDIDVPIAPLDDFLRDGPNVIKIDTEGSEIEVLRGAESALKSCELLILEMSIFRRMEGEGKFGEIVRYLDQRGFELFDIPVLLYPIPDRDLTLIDAFFVPSARHRAGSWISSPKSS